MKAYTDLAQKTFIFSRKPCLLSVIFIRRLYLKKKKIVVIVTRKFCFLESYRFSRKLCLPYFLELYIRRHLLEFFIQLQFYIYQKFIYLFICFIYLFYLFN